MMLRVTGAWALAVSSAIAGTVACSPASPSCTDLNGRGETQFNSIDLVCGNSGSTMQCRATASIKGLYVYCPMSQDITAAASWLVGNPTIVKSDGSGVFESGRAGDTVITAKWQNLASYDKPVSVFPGTPPYPTYEIFGTVSNSTVPPPLSNAAMNGATVTILDGLLAGRSVTSGVPPPLLPGYFGPFGGTGYYRLLAVPPGTYTVRATKDGYLPLTKVGTVGYEGGPSIDFPLVPITSK